MSAIQTMKDFLKKPGSMRGAIICFFILIAIANYIADHWRSNYRYVVLFVLGLLFLWKFFLQPLRAGLKEEGDQEKKSS
jgi:hypothetical protein